MKKLIFLIAIVASSLLHAQTEFAPIGAEWYYTYTFGCCPEDHFNRIVSEKDTVINGNNCRILKMYYDNSNTANEKYIIKQEQGKIYYYYQNQFHLLLDFDTNINDTVKFTFIYKEYSDDFPAGKDTVFTARFRVESISTNAQNLMVVTTKVFEEDMFDFWGISVPPFLYYSYTEKIGLLNLLGSPLHREFIPVLDNIPHPAIQDFRWLRCYSETEFSFVSNEWTTMSLPCNYSNVTGINTQRNKNLKIYPNPFNKIIIVFTKNEGNIKIIDVLGKIFYSSELSNGINEISTCFFPKGIYFVKIQNKDSSIQIFKIIKP